MQLSDTPVTSHQFDGLNFYLKRDDLLHPQFSGNKARKFLSLLETPPAGIDSVIGYGSPQANSLYSLAALAKLNGWKCQFYVDHIPQYLLDNPLGNYREALALGAEVIEVPEQWRDGNTNTELALKAHLEVKPNQLFVEEGGRMPLAEYGVAKLASEIQVWVQEQNIQNAVVALPSGTGTTALYLHKHLAPYGVEVWTAAVVGGADYLSKQFEQLGGESFPQILSLDSKHHFGKLYQHDYQIWQALKQQTGVEFELLYDPLMWRTLQANRDRLQQKSLIYVHQGGLLGNQSMLPRYQRKYPQLHSS